MAETVFNSTQGRTPYWTNVPPNVPKYAMPPEMFRRGKPEQYTAPVGKQSWQNWTDKWYDFERPVRRQEELRQFDRREPCMRPADFNPGTCNVLKWSRAGKDFPSSPDYFTRGTTECEATRARGMNRLMTTWNDPKLYPHNTWMQSTYRKPVYTVFGPLQRKQVYGVTHQHNKHGNMNFEDYY